MLKWQWVHNDACSSSHSNPQLGHITNLGIIRKLSSMIFNQMEYRYYLNRNNKNKEKTTQQKIGNDKWSIMHVKITVFDTRQKKPFRKSRYAVGQKYCANCCLFIMWDGVRCPCCNYNLKYSPTSSRYKVGVKRI